MKQTAKQLRQIKGIGEVLVKRLQDAGLDSFAKIARAEQESFKKIKGLHQRDVSSIREQALRLAEAGHPDHRLSAEQLQQRLSEVKGEIRTLAQATRDRFEENMAGKCGKKLDAELVRIEETLERLNLAGKKRAKRAGKALDTVHQRVGDLAEDASLKKVRKTLKRARQTVVKAAR